MRTDHADAELMRRWQNGDLAAFELMVRRWQGPIARFAARYLGADDVQDVCQEVFLRVYQAGHAYRPVAALSTWLYHIALNTARDAVRKRRPTAPLPPAEPASGDTPAESVCEQKETVEQVNRAIAELPETLRLVLILRHYEGMSFEAIGRMLKVAASTLKSRFAAALSRLRLRLRHLGESHEEVRR